MFSWQMRNSHYKVLESKHGGRSNVRNTGGARERSQQSEPQRSPPSAAPVHRALTQRQLQSHTQSHTGSPLRPNADPRSHTSDLWALGYFRAQRSLGPGGPQQTGAPSPAPFPQLGGLRDQPTEQHGAPSASRLQHRTPKGPGAALPALPRPAAALSPLPSGEEASTGGTASTLPCFGTSPLPERGAAAGLTGCWRRGGKPGPFSQPVQAAWQLGAASRPPPDRTRRMFKAPSD